MFCVCVYVVTNIGDLLGIPSQCDIPFARGHRELDRGESTGSIGAGGGW